MRFAFQPRRQSFFQPSLPKPMKATPRKALGSKDITLWGNYTESSRLEETAHIILMPNECILQDVTPYLFRGGYVGALLADIALLHGEHRLVMEAWIDA